MFELIVEFNLVEDTLNRLTPVFQQGTMKDDVYPIKV